MIERGRSIDAANSVRYAGLWVGMSSRRGADWVFRGVQGVAFHLSHGAVRPVLTTRVAEPGAELTAPSRTGKFYQVAPRNGRKA